MFYNLDTAYEADISIKECKVEEKDTKVSLRIRYDDNKSEYGDGSSHLAQDFGCSVELDKIIATQKAFVDGYQKMLDRYKAELEEKQKFLDDYKKQLEIKIKDGLTRAKESMELSETEIRKEMKNYKIRSFTPKYDWDIKSVRRALFTED